MATDYKLQDRTYPSDPRNPDTDGDGWSDGREANEFFTDPGKLDSDGDGLTDRREIEEHGTLAWQADSDGDDLGDADELAYGYDPTSPDTDSDGTNDGYQHALHQADTAATEEAHDLALPTDEPDLAVEDQPDILDTVPEITSPGVTAEATPALALPVEPEIPDPPPDPIVDDVAPPHSRTHRASRTHRVRRTRPRHRSRRVRRPRHRGLIVHAYSVDAARA